MNKEKIVIISTIGLENPEKATLPFVFATAAQSMDVEVVMFLQSEAVVLSKKGEAENVRAHGLLPLKELLDNFYDEGGKLYICAPCIKERGISAKDLVQGAEPAAAGTLVDEVISAKSVLTY
ncbi:MAG: DsrE family protein [Bacteroidales bacterium]|nr:DsrE family protein [Bacteroidales bacterium]